MGGPGLAESRPMLRRATLLLLLLPGIALGQTPWDGHGAVSTQGTTGQANRADCASTTTLSTWNLVTTVTPVVANGDKWRLGTATTHQRVHHERRPPHRRLPGRHGHRGHAVHHQRAGQHHGHHGGRLHLHPGQRPGDQPLRLLPPGRLDDGRPLAAQGNFNFQLAIPPKPTISGVARVTPSWA